MTEPQAQRKAILFANTDWYLYNFRLSLAEALKDGGYEVLLISPRGKYGRALKEAGFRWQPVPMDRRSLNPFRELRFLGYLARLYRRERPDIVHHFTVKCVVYGAIAAALARVPARVHAVAGMGYVFSNPSLGARLLRPLVRSLMRGTIQAGCSRLVLQNHDDVAGFIESGIADRDRIRLIRGSGVATDRFAPGPSRRGGQDRTRVLMAARLLLDKGVLDYVEAARILRQDGAEIEFLLAGRPDPGNPSSIAQVRLNAWEAEGLITLLGHVEDMQALFANVDICVLPSHREGLPKSLIEAAASGLPLITTDVPGCREVVTHEKEGLLVPARDPDGLAAAIRRLHEDPALAYRLGRAAREKAIAEFDEQIVIRQTLGVYDELLANARRPERPCADHPR